MKHVLAIDYGTERIGLAISRSSLADPYGILDAHDQPIQKIQAICQRENIGLLVVGLSENVMAEKTKEFAEKLKTELGLPIEFADETLSSHSVATRLKEMGASLNRRQGPIDDLAAAVFLQEWLDSYAILSE